MTDARTRLQEEGTLGTGPDDGSKDAPRARLQIHAGESIQTEVNSLPLKISLQIVFSITTLMCFGAITTADSLLSAMAVIPAFALTLFPISNFVLMLWIILNRRVRRTLTGDILVNTPTYANHPLIWRPGPDDLDLDVTIQVPVYTERFSVIRETLEHALAASAAYNEVSRRTANLVVSDDALMLWADNDLPGFLARAESKQIDARSETETKALERVDFYRHKSIAFIARAKPIHGHEPSQRRGRFKKAGNLNKTIRLADAIAAKRAADGVDYQTALEQALAGDAFRGVHAEGTIEIGDVILMLDKDSITPSDALVLTIPEFVHDERLAFTQHKTVASNAGESYFTGIMSLFTQLLFNLAFPAKALQGWMPPFMGHNGFVRTSMLADSGYWSEDRVGEDLSFAMWATAAGNRGKYIAYEGVSFGEQVTRTYSEEAAKYHRYGFSILEIILNPVSSWLRRGVFTNRFKRYLRSPRLSWEHKMDLMVVYPFFYINLALIPIMTPFIPFAGINLLIYGFIFFLSLAPPLLLAGAIEGGTRSKLTVRLLRFQALGFLFVSWGFAILRGFTAFASAQRKIVFGVTSVEALDDDRRMSALLSDISPQLIAAAIMIGVVTMSYAIAYRLGILEWYHIAASLPVLVSIAILPVIMSPALLQGIRRGLSSKR